MATHGKPGVDVILALGGGPKKGAPAGNPADEMDMGPSDGDDQGLDPAFEAAWKEYHDRPTAQSFWDAVEACHDAKVGSDEKMKKNKNPWPGQGDNFVERNGSGVNSHD